MGYIRCCTYKIVHFHIPSVLPPTRTDHARLFILLTPWKFCPVSKLTIFGMTLHLKMTEVRPIVYCSCFCYGMFVGCDEVTLRGKLLCSTVLPLLLLLLTSSFILISYHSHSHSFCSSYIRQSVMEGKVQLASQPARQAGTGASFAESGE